MKNYIYQNDLIGKKQLRQILAWSFTNYNSMQACSLADELKYLGFQYASQAGISISIEDLKIPFVKNLMLEKANLEITNAEKLHLKGRITDVERFQKIIDTWSLTSESLKDQIIYYFKNYDPLNSVYIMAFSGARGNLSQVRQLVGMRGLMSDPSGEIMNLPIKKNFREGLTITDYLMSGYGARKGIVDTALKTANSGYLTRRLIDVSQDILIREKDCLTEHFFLITANKANSEVETKAIAFSQILGRVLGKNILDPQTKALIAKSGTQITSELATTIQEKSVLKICIRSPLTCNLYRSVCQKCYGWDLATENLVDIGEAIGILAGQSIGEPGTQLTMRTFHTGGIFTSEARQQIISPANGILQFYKFLKTILLRTNRGEDVLITKNSGSVVLIPQSKNQKLVQIEVLRNTILFPKNNQYILKDTVIGELINTSKQTKIEVKPILSDTCGEIFMPQLKRKVNLLNNNKLVWILSGQLYSSPNKAFLNFYPDRKLNCDSYIFRTKITTHYGGFVRLLNHKANLYQRIIKIANNRYSLSQSKLQKLTSNFELKNYLLNLGDSQYLLRVKEKGVKIYLQTTRANQVGALVDNSFRTLTGGILYYDYRNLFLRNVQNRVLSYYHHFYKSQHHGSLICHRSVFWLGEEVYRVNCEQSVLLVDHGNFISEGFEIIPGLFSKTSGLVVIRQKSGLVKTITIKSGLVYEGKKFRNAAKKIYFPGETLFSGIIIKDLSLCEHIIEKKTDQLLVRPVKIYELSRSNKEESMNTSLQKGLSGLCLKFGTIPLYRSGQTIKGSETLNLMSSLLKLNDSQRRNIEVAIELKECKEKKVVQLKVTEKLKLNTHIAPRLKYTNIQSCVLIQKNQFVSNYAVLGYLEAITKHSVEIVKLKIKKSDSKEILLISNNDCLVLKKSATSKKKLGDFITTDVNLEQSGKILIENENFLTIQKGRPYFFPNCKDDGSTVKSQLQYKLVPTTRFNPRFNVNRKVSLSYFDITKFSVTKKSLQTVEPGNDLKPRIEFSKFFSKKNNKLYSSLVPQLFKKLTINKNKFSDDFEKQITPKLVEKLSPNKIDRTVLIRRFSNIQNLNKESKDLNHQLALLKFVEQPFSKSTKSIGLYSITEEYFEQDVNSVFCKNSEFIETGKTLGLLNLEKEITGDIVQGLPRIEEILEARKKNLIIKKIPTSQKKGLLAQSTSLDPSFEFKKLGMPIKENDKINPHKLLKVYFNYYGLTKAFICARTKTIKHNRLMNNYEGSYKSFKKVQLFILNSVQSVYQSQGVTINDKHLEVIIKQMTAKVLITYEGDTPLLRQEVVDLYHIQYINNVIKARSKQEACYVPLLLGITKAALNNPSFISAASFQETTRVLTRAAIEGRIDWLRGLKENIIIGHLIPAGTGSQNYRNGFTRKNQNTQSIFDNYLSTNTLKQKSRQVF